MHQWRENVKQVLRCTLISSTIVIVWKSLMVLTNTANPIVVLLSGGIDLVFYHCGTIFLLTNYCSESIRAGDIIVFRIQGRDIFIVHRVIRVHEKEDGYVKFLTKGDFNQLDDHGLYAPGQVWLEKKDVVGKVKGYIPYVVVGLFVSMNYKDGKPVFAGRQPRFLDIWIFFTTIRFLARQN